MADERQSGAQKKSPKYDESMDEDDEEEELFEVEEIIGKSKSKGVVSYKVRWKGYGPDEDTWEPEDNLGSCQELIDDFNKKREENLRQKAEERKLRQQMMEGRLSSSDSSEDNSNSPYPPNFKNSFWKDLEAGRIDVFDSNIYSKVKERRVKIQSLKEFKASKKGHEDESSQKDTRKENNKPEMKLHSEESASTSNDKKKHKKLSSQKGKDSKGDKPTGEKSEHTLTQHKSKKVSNIDDDCSSKPEKQRKRRISETMEVLNKSSVTKNSSKINVKLKNISGQWTSEFVPAKKCCDSSSAGVKIKCETEIKTETCTDAHSSTSNTSMEIDTPTDNKSSASKKDKDYSGLDPKGQSMSTGNNKQSVKEQLNISAIKPEQSSDLNSLDRSHMSHDFASSSHDSVSLSHDLVSMSHDSASLSHDFSLNSSVFSANISPISHQSDSKTHFNNSVVTPSNTSVVNKVDHEKHPQTFLSCNTNIVGKQRLDSETVDSGIASPASEKSLGLSRCESGNPLDDVLDRSLLPFLPDADKIQVKETDHDFEINLDDLDWDLFDREVKLEPITLSNEEFVRAVMTGDYELVKQALMGEGKYNLEHADQTGKTLLMHAAQHAYDDIADLLIEHGANINARMNNGVTPLMTACQFAELCTVNLLIELGAKVNLQTQNGESALMIAVRRGHRHITWLLLECGANFSLKSHAGYTALNYAQAFHHADTESVITTHIKRVLTEFEHQITITLNNLASIREMVFPPQVFNISEEEMFQVNFNHLSQLPPIHGLGYILFLGHAVFTSEDVKCRFYGPCAVKSAYLNGTNLTPLTKAGNFVLAFNPVKQGNNILTINTVKEANMKGKLIVCAYKAQLV